MKNVPFFKNLLNSNSGFGLLSVMIGLLILTIITASAIPYMDGFNKLKQAKAALNTANSLIKAEIQYQQADYSNYAEKNAVPQNGDYFGTLPQLISGMNILPDNNLQHFLPQGISLSLADYQGNDNCINKPVGGGYLTECLVDEENGQFKLVIYGLNNPNMSRFVPMLENGIKGGLSAYSGGAFTAQVSVPFGFSAYPKIQNGNGGGNTVVNNYNNNNNNAVKQAQASANQALVNSAWAYVNSINEYGNPQAYNSAVNYAQTVDATVCGSFNVIC